MVLPDTVSAKLTPFEEQAVRFFVEAAGVVGVPKSVAMIYGVLFGSPTPLSFNEIESKLEISKGSVSQGLRVLRDMGAVEPAVATEQPFQKGESGGSSTLSHYQAVVEIRLLLKQLLTDKIQPHLEASREAISTMSATLEDESDPPTVLETRLRHLRAWQKRSQDLLPLIKTFLH